MIYETYSGWYLFNELVEVTAIFLPPEETKGRLIQVRKNRGAFGSDIYLVRLPSGKLRTFENVGLAKLKPDAIPFPEEFEDSETQEYTICNEFPETGFIIENPQQPNAPPASFSVVVNEANKTTRIFVEG